MNKSNIKLDEHSIDIIDAVNAERARAGLTGKQLAQSLGHDRNWIYERFRHEKPFDTDDLAGIASTLGTTVDVIFRSARIGHEIRTQAVAA
jgi:ribosome-binding protein aMBF1 (putative translation factor)